MGPARLHRPPGAAQQPRRPRPGSALIGGHDAIQQVRDVPNWSENLLFTLHGPVAVWAHWSRIPADPAVWEAVLAVYLPDGEVLVHRSFGRGADAASASSGPASFRCLQPLQRWALSFDGAMRRTSSAELAAGPLADGPPELVRVELDFDGLAPTWSARSLEDQEWADGHLEQPGRITGTVTVGGREIAVDGTGFRDHSYGPRDYSKILGDVWLTGVFPGGRSLLALVVWTAAPDVPPLVTGFVDNGGARHAVTAVLAPRLAAPDGAPHAFTAQVTTSAGTARIDVRQTHCATYTFDTPVGMTLGARRVPGDIVATEGPARLTWDGEETDGWIEKTLRYSELDG